MTTNKERINHYAYGEVKTANDQLVEFTCHPDNVWLVKEFFEQKVRSIDIPTTGRVNIQHGGYGRYTRYDATQYRYACTNIGYIEVLEIKNTPDERSGFVIYEYSSKGLGRFAEWVSLEDATSAFDTYMDNGRGFTIFPTLLGFIRNVECGRLCPWFYAVGDEVLVGDYTFPDGLQDDPVYKFGVKFLVPNANGTPSIKTCMGTRFVENEERYNHDKVERYRLVYFSDGSIWDERNTYPHWSSKGIFHTPRILQDNEMWVVEAMDKFEKLLSGETSEFSIDFIDGNKFVGEFVKSNPKLECAQGDFNLAVNIKGKQGVKEGWINNFVPSIETPDIVSFVVNECKQKGNEVERVEIKEAKVTPGGKKWSGVFYEKR